MYEIRLSGAGQTGSLAQESDEAIVRMALAPGSRGLVTARLERAWEGVIERTALQLSAVERTGSDGQPAAVKDGLGPNDVRLQPEIIIKSKSRILARESWVGNARGLLDPAHRAEMRSRIREECQSTLHISMAPRLCGQSEVSDVSLPALWTRSALGGGFRSGYVRGPSPVVHSGLAENRI